MVAEGMSVTRSGLIVSRADVAHFMFKTLQINDWDNKRVAMGGKDYLVINFGLKYMWSVNQYALQSLRFLHASP